MKRMDPSPIAWICSAHCPKSEVDEWLGQHGALLPANWMKRIQNYTCPHDQALSVAGKCLLRQGLEWLGIGPRIGELHYPAGCRPILTEHPSVRFSIAHSGEWVVCAVGVGIEVGIDIECRKNHAVGPLRRFFAPEEWEHIEAAADPLSLFYRFWVGKEAIIKAANSVDIDRFDTIDTSCLTPFAHGKRWYLTPVTIHPDYTCWFAGDTPPLVMTNYPFYISHSFHWPSQLG